MSDARVWSSSRNDVNNDLFRRVDGRLLAIESFGMYGLGRWSITNSVVRRD